MNPHVLAWYVLLLAASLVNATLYAATLRRRPVSSVLAVARLLWPLPRSRPLPFARRQGKPRGKARRRESEALQPIKV